MENLAKLRQEIQSLACEILFEPSPSVQGVENVRQQGWIEVEVEVKTSTSIQGTSTSTSTSMSPLCHTALKPNGWSHGHLVPTRTKLAKSVVHRSRGQCQGQEGGLLGSGTRGTCTLQVHGEHEGSKNDPQNGAN